MVVGAFETTADDFYQRDGGIVCLGAISDICSSMDHGVPEDNVLAEAMAMLFALLIVASRPWVVSAEILLDCDPIKLMLQSSAMLYVLGPFGELVVGVYHFVSASKRITIRHTHAHKGQPWNELADSLAKSCSSRRHAPHSRPQVVRYCSVPRRRMGLGTKL